MSDIGIQIDYTGVEQGGQQIDAVVQRLGALLTAEERAAISAQQFERAMEGEARQASELRGALATAEQAHNRLGTAAQGAGRTMVQTAGQAGQLFGAFGNIGQALQGIHPQLGQAAQGFSSIGSAVAASATTMGPLGVAIGVVTAAMGGLSLALQLTRDDTEDFRQSIENTIPTLDDLLTKIRQVNAERARESRIGLGLGAGEEQEAALSQAQRAASRARGAETTLERNIRGRRTAGQGIFQEEEDQLRRLHEATQAAEREVERLTALRQRQQTEEAQSLEEDLAAAAAEDEEREAQRARRGRRGGRGAAARRQAAEERETSELGAAVLGDLDEGDVGRAIEEEAAAQGLREQIELTDQLLEMKQFFLELDEQQATARQEALEKESELVEKLKQEEMEAAQEREEAAREIHGRIEDTLASIAGAYIDAFGEAIEGQKSMEQAALDATKMVLKGLGEEMVGIGLKETIEGFANIVSNPPVAATKIPAGIALIGIGVGLGAAGAAIPSQPSAPPESPRSEEEESGGEGGTVILNINQPIISAATHAQLARGLKRQIGGDREFPARTTP